MDYRAAAVTIPNLSATSDMVPVYRRVMDWDMVSTPFEEYVTVGARRAPWA